MQIFPDVMFTHMQAKKEFKILDKSRFWINQIWRNPNFGEIQILDKFIFWINPNFGEIKIQDKSKFWRNQDTG